MKIIIEIPEKTNARIRSDYGHGVKGLTDEDGVMLVDAVYSGTPYAHGEWEPLGEHDDLGIYSWYICSSCGFRTTWHMVDIFHFCPNCGSDNRPRKDGEK